MCRVHTCMCTWTWGKAEFIMSSKNAFQGSQRLLIIIVANRITSCCLVCTYTFPCIQVKCWHLSIGPDSTSVHKLSQSTSIMHHVPGQLGQSFPGEIWSSRPDHSHHYAIMVIKSTVQPRLSEPRLTEPSIIQTPEPEKIRGQSTRLCPRDPCAHAQ